MVDAPLLSSLVQLQISISPKLSLRSLFSEDLPQTFFQVHPLIATCAPSLEFLRLGLLSEPKCLHLEQLNLHRCTALHTLIVVDAHNLSLGEILSALTPISCTKVLEVDPMKPERDWKRVRRILADSRFCELQELSIRFVRLDEDGDDHDSDE